MKPLRRQSSLQLAIAISIVCTFARPAHAASATWLGTTDVVWATATNWSATPVPGTGDVATFDSAGGTVDTINLGAGITIQSVVFDTANAANYTIGSGAVGSQKLTLNNAGGVTMNAAVVRNQTFNPAVVLGTDGSAQSFTLSNHSTTNSLIIAGGITGSTGAGIKTLGAAGAGPITLSGIIGNGTTGTVALTKSGAGMLTLSNTGNAYSGGVVLNPTSGTVTAGVTNGTNKSGLGTGAVLIDAGSTLNLLSANTVAATAAINNVFTGTGTLKLTFTDTTATNTTLGNLPGFTGTIQLSNSGVNGDKWNAANLGILNAALIIDSGSQLYANGGPTTLANGITMTGTGNSETRGAIRLAATLGGNITLLGNASIGSEGGTLTGDIKSGAGGSQVLTVGTTNSTGNATLSGSIQDGTGTIALTKAAAGILTLSGTNTYTDATNVNAGTLLLAKSTTLSQYHNVTVAGGATLAVITGDGTTGWSEEQIDTLRASGVTWTTADSRLGFDTTLGDSTYHSVIAENHSLLKLGANSLTLTAANSFTGSVYAVAGTLVAANTAAFGGPGKNLTFAGGTVDFATDTPVDINLANLGSGSTGTIRVNRATPGPGITHTVGVSTLGNGTLNVQSGGNVTSGTPVLAFQGINLTAGAAGTLTLSPTTASISIIGPVNIGLNSAAKTIGLGGTGSGNVISGPISNGLNTVSINKSGASTWTLSGANAHSGATTVAGGMLILDYSVEDNSKLADGAALVLAGGTLHLSAGTQPEVVASTTLTANTTSAVSASPGAPLLHLNTITPNTGARVNFAASGIATTDNPNINGILGAWATVGGTDWAINSTDGDDGPITPLTTYTLSSAAGNTAANYLDKNISVNSSQTLDLGATPNSLRFSAAGANTLTLTDVNTITTGGILVTSEVGANPITISGGMLSGGPNGDLSITQNNTAGSLTIASIIENNGTTNIVKSGPGTAILTGDNTYTGATTVAGGTLTLSGAKSGASGTINVSTLGGIDATLNIGNGEYALGTNAFLVGSAVPTPATGTVNQSGGTVSFVGAGNGLLLGNNGSTTIPNTGNYNLSGGSITTGSTSANRGVIIGTNHNTIATFTLSGTGVLNMNAATGGTATSVLEVGRFDSGANNTIAAFNQTGGTANVAILSVGGNGGTGIGLSSTMNLAGGVFVADAFPRLAAGNSNVAEINLSGTADVTLPAIPAGRGTGSTATINFDGGTLRSRAASGTYLNAPTNAFIKAGGANFNIATGSDIAIAQGLLTHPTSIGGGLTKAGPGKLALTGTSTYTGLTSITEGALSIGSPAALPGWDTAGKYAVASGATLGVYNAVTEAEIATLLATGNFAAGALLGFDTTSGDRIYPGSLGDTTAGALGLEKLGANVLNLSGPNSYSGLTSVKGGELRITHAGAIGGSAAIVHAGGRLNLDGGMSIPSGKSITINGDGVNFFGALQCFSGDAEWQGNVTVGSAGARLGANASGIGTGSLRISGVIDSGAVVTGLVIRSNTGGTVELAGASTYLGDTNIAVGTLKLSGGGNRLPTGTKLLMGIANYSGLLDLNGQSQEVAGLSVNQTTAPFTNEVTSASPATFTVNTAPAAPSTYSGRITGLVSLLKKGDDVLTLSGANSYTGNTTVESGTLIITAPNLANSSILTIGTLPNSPAVLDLPTTGTDTVAALFIDGVPQPDGLYDSNNSGGAITGAGSILVVSSTPFQLWAVEKITAINPTADATPGGDPDGDGRSNLAEFAFDGNPLSGANEGKIVGKVASVGGSGVLTLTLPVRAGATFSGGAALVSAVIDGITYTIEGSDNLVTWPLDIDEVTGGDADAIKSAMPPLSSGAWSYRTFRTPDAVTADPTDFIRAKVQ